MARVTARMWPAATTDTIYAAQPSFAGKAGMCRQIAAVCTSAVLTIEPALTQFDTRGAHV